MIFIDMKKYILTESQFNKIYDNVLKEQMEELGGEWMDKSSEERAEQLFGKQTNLEKQFSKIAVDGLSSTDDVISYKWSVYNSIMADLEDQRDFTSIKEIEYRVTDGEDPDKVFLDILKRIKRTPKTDAAKKVIENFQDIKSEKDLDVEDYLAK